MAVIQCAGVEFSDIQAIVFDKDGTLADSQTFLRTLAQKRARRIDAQVPGVQEPLLMAFGLLGETLNPQGLMAVGSRYENEVAAAAYVAETGRDWAASLALVRQAFAEADSYLAQKAESTPPYPGTQALLANLSGHGIKVGILSSDSPANIQDFLRFYHLESFVDHTQGTQPGGISKPNPELLFQVCQALGVAPASTLVIGDSELDRLTARTSGAAGFVWIDWTRTGTLPTDADAALQDWSALKLQTQFS